MNKTAPEVRLALDAGLSGTKCVYSVNGGEPKFLLLPPEVIELPRVSIEFRSDSFSSSGFSTPENNAWIAFQKKSKSVFAVGFLARQFMAEAQLEVLKYEEGVYKVLCALGVILQKENLQNEEVRLRLHVLLPFGEFQNRQVYEGNLRRGLKRYFFRGRPVQVALSNFLCSPEGGGAIWSLISRHGKAWFETCDNTTVLMFGHRNTSALIFSQKTLDLKQSSTTNLGFSTLLDKFVELTSGQDKHSLAKTIYEIGSDISSKNKMLRTLIRSRERKNIEAEATMLADSLKIAREEYWILLNRWLFSAIPERVDHVVVTGGAGHYLRSELDDFLDWAAPTWEEISRDEKISGLDDLAMRYRFADVYRLFIQTLTIKSDGGA